MNTEAFDYEVLDLGLVLYKNVIQRPKFIIDMVNSIDKRLNMNEHKDSFTKAERLVR